MKKIYKYKKVPGVEKGFETKVFGQQLPSLRAIRDYKESARVTYLGVKRRSIASAFKEFIDLYSPDSYYMDYIKPSNNYSDDSIQVWFTSSEVK